MEIVNAISKVRFASTGPQTVHLAHGDRYRVDLLCMEAGQANRPATGPCSYYVVAGSAKLAASGPAGKQKAPADGEKIPAGQLAQIGPGETHTIANDGEGRLICLVFWAPE